MCAGAAYRLLENVKAADAGSVGEHIGMAFEMIDQSHLRPPIIGEAAKMRDDKIHVGVFARQQFHYRHIIHNVIQYR